MSAPDLTAAVMASLRGCGAEKHTTLLLGAGASTTSGLPGWDELVVRLLVDSGVVPDGEAGALVVSRQDPLIAVAAAREAYGATWDRKLRAALYDGIPSVEISPLHYAAVAHALGGAPAETSLATLNFDTLLEHALRAETEYPVIAATGEDVPPGLPTYVVRHLHGIVSPTQTRDVVLTLTDFLDLVAERDSWQSVFLRQAVGRGALIIAGTSYRDPDVRQWLHAALAEAPQEHAAVVLLARQGFDVTKAQFAELAKALSGQWTAIGLRPVLLDDFSDAAQVIRELRHVDSPGYRAPQERIAQIWDHHLEGFLPLQQEYVEQLRVDADDLRSAFDVDVLNLSLWLSDGRVMLARWAAQDRVFLDRHGLRRVETGFDSPWIAGQALGSDTLLHKDLPRDGVHRWTSVLALPLPAPHPVLPTATAGVLTIGLPEAAARYEGSKLLWGETLARVGDAWSSRLTRPVFAEAATTIETVDEED